MRTTKLSLAACDCAPFGVDVVTPDVLLIADEFIVSLVVALFTFVAATFGVFAVLLMLFRAMFSISLLLPLLFLFICSSTSNYGQISIYLSLARCFAVALSRTFGIVYLLYSKANEEVEETEAKSAEPIQLYCVQCRV